MTQMIREMSESLTDDLYEKNRAQLNTFIDETNALLAAGDVLHEDRTALARERLTEFLKRAEAVSAAPAAAVPPVTRAVSSARTYVKANPWVAVGAAAGVGVLVSLLLNRRS